MSVTIGQFHKLWRELHTCRHPSPDWLDQFALRIRCDGCRRHWREVIATHPPIFNDWFAWTVRAHNEINRRLGKPHMTVAAARRLWQGISQERRNAGKY